MKKVNKVKVLKNGLPVTSSDADFHSVQQVEPKTYLSAGWEFFPLNRTTQKILPLTNTLCVASQKNSLGNRCRLENKFRFYPG